MWDGPVSNVTFLYEKDANFKPVIVQRDLQSLQILSARSLEAKNKLNFLVMRRSVVNEYTKYSAISSSMPKLVLWNDYLSIKCFKKPS